MGQTYTTSCCCCCCCEVSAMVPWECINRGVLSISAPIRNSLSDLVFIAYFSLIFEPRRSIASVRTPPAVTYGCLTDFITASASASGGPPPWRIRRQDVGGSSGGPPPRCHAD